MTDDVSSLGLLRGVGAVGIGVGALALFPSLSATVPLTKVFMLAKNAGIWHDAVPTGIAAIHQLGDRNGFTAEDATTFMTRNVAQYEAVVWLSTSGDVPGGVYAEADTDDWAWRGRLVGAYRAAGAGQQQATLCVEDTVEPFVRYRTNPHCGVKVLMRLAEPSSDDGSPGASHPFTWWHDFGAGRAWYSECDLEESYSDMLFTRLCLPGLCVAVRAKPPVTGDDDDPPRSHRRREPAAEPT